MNLLSISSLKAYYGESQALFDVNLEVNEGDPPPKDKYSISWQSET